MVCSSRSLGFVSSSGLAFEVAGGSVIGRSHRTHSKANQDAFCWRHTDRTLVAIACDGCGSGAHSEVGAQIGARLVARAILQELAAADAATAPDLTPDVLKRVEQNVLPPLGALVPSLTGSRSETDGAIAQAIREFLLFTVVGAVLTPDLTTVFACGDGVIAINGEVTVLNPGDGNRPSYLTYRLLEDSSRDMDSLQILQQRPTAEVQSLLIGTDGLTDLLAHSDQPLPGKTEPVGSLTQFWTNDFFFKNPDGLRRRLALINRDVTRADWLQRRLVRESGWLSDDTTAIAIRRCAPHP